MSYNPWAYDPGITYQGPEFLSRGLNALGQGVGQFLQEQNIKRQQNELDQQELQKNTVIMNHLGSMKGPDGNPYVDPQTMVDFQTAASKGDYKKTAGIAQGAAADFASDLANQHQAMQYAPPRMLTLPTPPGSTAPPQTVITTPGGAVHNVTPFDPTQGAGTINVPGVGTVPFAHTSTEQIQTFPLARNPANAGQRETLPNGQVVIYDAKGDPHFSAPTPQTKPAPPDDWQKFSKDLQSASGATPFQWANSTGYKENPDGSVEATIPNATGKQLTIKLDANQRAQFDARQRALSGGVASPNAAPQQGQPLRVQGPNGQTGTVPAGTQLPNGWQIIK